MAGFSKSVAFNYACAAVFFYELLINFDKSEKGREGGVLC